MESPIADRAQRGPSAAFCPVHRFIAPPPPGDAMAFEFTLPATPPLKAKLQPGTWGGFKLFVNGKEIPRSTGAGKPFLVPLADGTKLRVEAKPGGFKLIPQVTANGQPVFVADPIPGWQVTLGALPFLLVFVGGAIGGAIGGVAAMTNMQIFAAKGPTSTKILITSAITIGAIGLWVVLAGAARGLFQ
jgi:hypothetical protein